MPSHEEDKIVEDETIHRDSVQYIVDQSNHQLGISSNPRFPLSVNIEAERGTEHEGHSPGDHRTGVAVGRRLWKLQTNSKQVR